MHLSGSQISSISVNVDILRKRKKRLGFAENALLLDHTNTPTKSTSECTGTFSFKDSHTVFCFVIYPINYDPNA